MGRECFTNNLKEICFIDDGNANHQFITMRRCILSLCSFFFQWLNLVNIVSQIMQPPKVPTNSNISLFPFPISI
ncbi:Uncharacterized protein TCM_045146 [Theobroma cacao]|uniref:Uncharacterized protein n=1 Tax=Theobroma cacao TaxID=3641 RepID=A0A061FSD2_THECC|nr:Uncharacterized protein TCM_045146 [Theobroma cacao]